MKQVKTRTLIFLHTFIAILFSTTFFISNESVAAGLSPDVENKIALYKKKLEQWSKDPEIVTAVIKMNTASASISNEKWKNLTNNDPLVKRYLSSTVSKKLSTWQEDKSLAKLFLRDKLGNLVAGSKKPAIFNISKRKAFTQASVDSAWHSKTVKSDPTTNQNAIQISTPVVSEGKKIGVLHTALIIE